jgi:hypothetical protein
MNSEFQSKANFIESNPFLLWLKHKTLRYSHFIDYSLRKDENERHMALSQENLFHDCPDWYELDKVPDAGKIRQGLLVMHNGVKVLPTAYQGYGHGKLMQRALGIHEPQEERLFRDVIVQLPAESSMIELGSYWAYYSLWFQQVIPDAFNLMVEPKLSHLNYGKRHFKLNDFKGEFLQAGVGKESSLTDDQLRIVTVDELLDIYSLSKLTILHSDIQGYELEMLQGSKDAIQNYMIDFFFISTHSDELHKDCLDLLIEANYQILDHYLINESWNPDGLILAQSPHIPKINVKPSIKINKA